MNQPAQITAAPKAPEKEKKPAMNRLQQNVAALYGGVVIGGAAASFIPGVGQAGLAVAGGAAATYVGAKAVEKIGIPMAESAVWSILDIGNPEGSHGRVGKFIDKVAKWGEKDIPPAFQKALDYYKIGIKAGQLVFLEGPAIGVSVALTIAGEGIRVGKEIKKKHDASEIKRKELEEKEAKAAQEQLERSLTIESFHKANGYGQRNLEAQRTIISTGIDLSGIPELAPFQNIIAEQNLMPFVYSTPEKFDDTDNFIKGAEERKDINFTTQDLLTTPKISGEPVDRLTKLYSYISNPEEPTVELTDEEQLTVRKVLKIKENPEDKEGINFDDLKIERVLVELERLMHEVSLGRTLDQINEETDKTIKFIDQLLPSHVKEKDPKASEADKKAESDANAKKLSYLKQFLTPYKELWIGGACVSTVRLRDDFGMQDMMPEDLATQFRELGIEAGRNPFMFLGFVNTPSESDLESRRNQYDNLLKLMPSYAQFKNGFEYFFQAYSKDQIKRNIDVISGMSRTQVEAFDVLTKTFVQINNSGSGTVGIEFRGQTVGLDRSIPADLQIINSINSAFGPHTPPINSNENMVYHFNELQDLIVLLQGRADLAPLLQVITAINDMPLLMNDTLFGNSEIGYTNSAINFIKSLNYPERLFRYLYAVSDGDLPALYTENPKTAADQITFIQELLYSKKRTAEKLLEIRRTKPEDFGKIRATNSTHMMRIVDGDIEIKRKTDKNRDHQRYIADLEVLNGELLPTNIRAPFPRLIKFAQQFEIKRNELAVRNYRDPQDFNKLRNGLNKLGRILFARLSEMDVEGGDIETHTQEFIDELNYINRYLGILYTLGFDTNKIYTENWIDPKLLKMYLNGYNLKEQGAAASSFNQNVAEGSYCLSAGQKINIKP